MNDEEHYESYLFINGTTLFTNDSYFSPRGWIDPGTCYQKCLWGKSYQNRERLKSDIELLHSIINVFFARSHFNKDTKYEELEISSICIFNSYIFQQDGASAHTKVLIQQSIYITSDNIFSILDQNMVIIFFYSNRPLWPISLEKGRMICEFVHLPVISLIGYQWPQLYFWITWIRLQFEQCNNSRKFQKLKWSSVSTW